MTERERLIELVHQARSFFMEDDDYESVDEYIADHLLSNGVIVPPCKVGDTVFEFSCDEPFLEYPNYYVVPSTVWKADKSWKNLRNFCPKKQSGERSGMEEKIIKYPCRGCIYFKACGETTRTYPCNGRKTKREAKKEKRK